MKRISKPIRSCKGDKVDQFVIVNPRMTTALILIGLMPTRLSGEESLQNSVEIAALSDFPKTVGLERIDADVDSM